MKILCIHAHYDDFEFVAAGTFELWRRQLGHGVRAKVIICTDGRMGHHFRTRDDTAQLRYQEQLASARTGGFELELLTLPNGRVPREGSLQPTGPLLAALWKAIRDFEPDYLFCPPVASDPLAGLHLDHLGVAEAVRRVAYLVNVPHMYLDEYPADESRPVVCRVPVILNVHDGYQAGATGYDLAVDVEEAFPRIAEMSYCHQSQIMEWLPWVGRHSLQPPRSLAEWQDILRTRLLRRNRALGIDSDRVFETFAVTAWGTVPELTDLLRDFPNLHLQHSRWETLQNRLQRWRDAAE